MRRHFKSGMTIQPSLLSDKKQGENITHLCWPTYKRTSLAMGGDGVAKFSFPIGNQYDAEKWLEERLGWHFVEHYAGKNVFVGFVHTIRVVINGVMLSVSLADMYNDITLIYKQNSAAAESTINTTSANSIAKYGVKQLRLDLGSSYMGGTTASRYLDSLLAAYEWPAVRMEKINGGRQQSRVEVEVHGYVETLNWVHYNTTDTTPLDSEEEVAAILAASINSTDGGYVEAGLIEEDSLDVVPEADYVPKWDRLKEITEIGGYINDRMISGCYGSSKFDYLIADTTSIRYFVDARDDGMEIYTQSGAIVPPPLVRPGGVAFMRNVLGGRTPAVGLLNDPRAFFIESVTYDAGGVKLHNATKEVDTRALLRMALESTPQIFVLGGGSAGNTRRG